jgi:hypothetical protein
MSKSVPEHLDGLNRPINIGDFVATTEPNARGINIAKVVGMSPKMVRVSLLGKNRAWGSDTYSRYPSDMVLVDEQSVTYYLLSKKEI